MNLALSGSLAIIIALSSFHASGQELSDEAKRDCVEAINERTTAFVAEDWEVVERLAKSYLKSCNGAFGDLDLSEAQDKLAIAIIELHRPSEGLKAAESCIERYYGNSSCHVEKVVALNLLGRANEARKNLAIAFKVINHNIDSTQRALARPVGGLERERLDRELLKSDLNKYEAQIQHASALKEQMAESP